jgi:hypothetical protein
MKRANPPKHANKLEDKHRLVSGYTNIGKVQDTFWNTFGFGLSAPTLGSNVLIIAY